MYIQYIVPHLVLMARALAVLGQCDHALVDELGIVGMDVEAEQHEPASRDATYAVQEAQGLSYEVVGHLTKALVTQVVLRREQGGKRTHSCHVLIYMYSTYTCTCTQIYLSG